jgi:uncharacterized repeat protein (TIGR03803 family)
MTTRFPLLSRSWWQGRNGACAAKSQRPFCDLLMLLVVSGCGGDGGGGGSTAQPFEVLYSFGTSPPDAMGPDGRLFQGGDGNFYGTTSGGGIGGGMGRGGTYTGNGTVFKITPAGEETVLHSFTGPPGDGANPEVLIQGSDGNFYGTTNDGGAGNDGTVFKLTPDGVETIVYSFQSQFDTTGGPTGELVQGSDGNLYGTTFGYPPNQGTLFKLTPEGALTVLHIFNGGAADGALPVGSLFQGSDGNIYGVTQNGGSADDGTVFKSTPEGARRSSIPFRVGARLSADPGS